MMMKWMIAAGLFLSGTVWAQNDVNVASAAEQAAFQECLNTNRENDCIGIVSQPCLNTEEGMSTAGMVGCTGRELALWDDLLNERYRALMAMYAADSDDETFAEYAANNRARYLTAQRAWMASRDADCEAEAGRYEGGSLARVVRVGCLLDQTARRAIWLGTQLQEG